jgi:hypothetical protein
LAGGGEAARPRPQPINWFVVQPMQLRASSDLQYIGTRSYTFTGDAADYIPASKFEKRYEPYGFQIRVTERCQSVPH